jgi:integrase
MYRANVFKAKSCCRQNSSRFRPLASYSDARRSASVRLRLRCLVPLWFPIIPPVHHQEAVETRCSYSDAYQEGAQRITSRLALEWATQPKEIQQAEWAARLTVVRGFARYCSAIDPTTEIPPEGLLPYRPKRAKPYLYSDEQIQQLLEAAKNIPAPHNLQPWTYHCLFGLLAVTGLRISEALNLLSTDVDCKRQTNCSIDRS